MDPYVQLFENYLVDLRAAREEALRWWDQLVARETDLYGNRSDAEHAVRLRWPLGPTAYPRVIAVFRKYYLLVDAINRDLIEVEETDLFADPFEEALWNVEDDEDSPIQHPRAVLYERLDEVDKVLARFMDYLVFIPVGADHDGRVV